MNKKSTTGTNCYVILMPFVVLAVIMLWITFSGCTYSINMVHNEGGASDLDEVQSTQAEVSPTLSPK